MSENERGSEIVQFAVTVPLLVLVVFATMQLGGMALAASQLSSEITRACRQFDAGGFERATDKEAFVEEGIVGASSQLRPESLHVERVRWERETRQEGSDSAGGAIEQRTSLLALSYDVRYELPSILDVPGLSGRSLERSVLGVFSEGRVIEVEVGP
ncbi:pilus assembly protein TadE [Gordonibacter sp. An230]|nr:pilus assembly protein TadE [Gordonibacter sp. An230]